MMSAADDRIRQLRSEIRDLEGAEHPLRVEEQRQAYLTALGQERRGAEHQRALGLQLGDERETIADPIAPGGFKLGERTGRDIALEAEKRLADIDAEADRVTRLG
jgi:hypothetical protein